MSDWQAGFERRIITFLMLNGSPVSKESNGKYSRYLARDWDDISAHARGCQLVYERCWWEDSNWTEFAGTFAEPQWYEYTGIDVVITCQCTRLRDQKFRYTGTYGDLITAISSMPDPDPEYQPPPLAGKTRRTPVIRKTR